MGPARSDSPYINQATGQNTFRIQDIPIDILRKTILTSRPKPKPTSISKSKSKPQRKRYAARPSKITRPDTSAQGQPAEVSSPAPRRLSMLEVLPVEVIEQIFLHSLNVNLPRASHALAAALSSERIYRLLILLAFWEDPVIFQQYPANHPGSSKNGSPAIRDIFKPVEYVRLNMGERSMLQALVFSCKWCTMDRILKQVPTMLNLTIQRQWLDEGVQMEPGERAELDRFMQRKQDTKLSFSGSGPLTTQFAEQMCVSWEEVMQMSRATNRGAHHYKLDITPMADVQITHTKGKIVLNWPALNLCYPPKKMLRGRKSGFTPEDVAFLEMLRITSSNYKRVNAISTPCTTSMVDRTALHEGVTKAIETQNYNALISLLKLDEYVFRWRVANQGEPVFYTIPSKHFEQVTRVGRDKPHLQQAFFEALLRASAESVPHKSAAITQWIVDNNQRALKKPDIYNLLTARFCKWLSNFMLNLPEQIEYARENPTNQLFTCGQLKVHDLEGDRFFEEVLEPSHRAALGNWQEESSFRLEDHWLVRAGPELPPGFRRS
ncbi:uncharacterized protein N7484_004848 [Penicillium longicatenatum]|uniref:uncharacterized protein n=1 Tax=Penicillium longicatenatum TaxID=1561947 RepID=UPI0025499889|nr:uncharacterized protein N7484_004848 [Penicillium longicatenatum]KAJ5651125.1 hypothetical protein N7484_004848 [Penicillium longicatenatum]